MLRTWTQIPVKSPRQRVWVRVCEDVCAHISIHLLGICAIHASLPSATPSACLSCSQFTSHVVSDEKRATRAHSHRLARVSHFIKRTHTHTNACTMMWPSRSYRRSVYASHARQERFLFSSRIYSISIRASHTHTHTYAYTAGIRIRVFVLCETRPKTWRTRTAFILHILYVRMCTHSICGTHERICINIYAMYGCASLYRVCRCCCCCCDWCFIYRYLFDKFNIRLWWHSRQARAWTIRITYETCKISTILWSLYFDSFAARMCAACGSEDTWRIHEMNHVRRFSCVCVCVSYSKIGS